MASFVQPEKPINVLSGLSKWERQELMKKRRAKLGKYELMRERTADKVKCPVVFCLPVVIVVLILLVLIGIYIVRPYQKAQELKETLCRVNRTVFIRNASGTCSHRTERFKPCIRIFVNFNIDVNQEQEGILMENEQALMHCDKCSFTFGSTSLLSKRGKCVWKPELGEHQCLLKYLENYGMPISPPYQCFYDPYNPMDVIRFKHITSGEIGYLITVPLLIILLWMGAVAFLLFDRYKRRLLNTQLLIKQNQKGKFGVKENGYVSGGKSHATSSRTTFTGSAVIDIDELKSSSIESTAVSSSTLDSNDVCDTIKRRRRKKKLPCCRPHQQFDYRDEGMILEDKPLSIDGFDQRSYSSSFVAIETAPACSCSHLGHNNAGMNFSPPTLFQTNGQIFGVNPGQVMRYLPESVV